MFLKKLIAYAALINLIGLLLLGCTSTKKNKQEIILYGPNQNVIQVNDSTGTTTTVTQDFIVHSHDSIIQNTEVLTILSSAEDSLAESIATAEDNEIVPQAILDTASPVAERIVENYLNSEKKEPGGHCLTVSKGRFEQAYKEVHGHLPYQDLPVSMASKFYTPKQVFNSLYASASAEKMEWRSLPEEYRGKGNAGAISYAGMGTLVDSSGVWSGQLKPGALMQVWRYREDYEKVVQGVNVQKLDPYGHSFIFINYLHDENNVIIGLRIADQGFQSYRPLRPSDYEVWWAVNLTI